VVPRIGDHNVREVSFFSQRRHFAPEKSKKRQNE
jgi:hypothetical protein